MARAGAGERDPRVGAAAAAAGQGGEVSVRPGIRGWGGLQGLGLRGRWLEIAGNLPAWSGGKAGVCWVSAHPRASPAFPGASAEMGEGMLGKSNFFPY